VHDQNGPPGGRGSVTGTSAGVTSPGSVLVRLPNWVGDCVMSLPAVEVIRRLYPGARLTFLARRGVAPLAPARDDERVVVVRDAGVRGFLGSLRGLPEKEIVRPALAFVFPDTLSAAWVPFRLGVPERVGYAVGLRRRPLLTLAAPPPRAVHRTRRYLGLVERHADTRLVPDPPRIEADPASRSRSEDLLVESGLAQGSPRVALGVGSRAPSRRWPPEFFGRLAGELRRNAGARCAALGGSADREAARKASRVGGEALVDLTGRVTLDRVPALLCGFDLLIANDSGLAHLGAAVGVPTMVLFGAGDPEATRPLGEAVLVHRLGIECSPCVKNRCPLGHHHCMRLMTPEGVLAALVGWDPAARALDARAERARAR
jgi:heptosyltransferase-2